MTNYNEMTSVFNFGDIVYLKTDPHQEPRMITGVVFRPGSIMYYLSLGEQETLHYLIEITPELDTLKKITMKVITIKTTSGEILHKENIHDPLSPIEKPSIKEKIIIDNETYVVVDIVWNWTFQSSIKLNIIVEPLSD